MAGPRLTRTAALAAALALAGLPAPARAQAGLAARVNGVEIPRERLDRAFDELLAERGRSAAAIRSPAAYRELRGEALDRLVDEELLWQEAVRSKRVAGPRAVQEGIAKERARLGSEEAFRRRLGRGSLTGEAFAEQVKRQLSISRLLEPELARLSVTDREAHDFYAANPSRFTPEGGETVPEERVRENLRAWLLERKRQQAVRDRVAALRAAGTVEILDR